MGKLSLILTCLLLAGCTRSDAPSEAPAPRGSTSAAGTASDTRPAIVVLGDSLAEGLGVAEEKAFPGLIQRKLDSGGYRYRVVNLGVAGDTTTGALGRLQYAMSMKPEVLVIELGGNDGLRGIPVAASKANLEKMIAAAQKAGAKVLLAGMTLPPNYGDDYIRSFEGVYRDLARQYKVELIPSLMKPIVDGIKGRPDLMQRDGIHPTASGHQLLAESVFQHLEPMLQRER